MGSPSPGELQAICWCVVGVTLWSLASHAWPSIVRWPNVGRRLPALPRLSRLQKDVGYADAVAAIALPTCFRFTPRVRRVRMRRSTETLGSPASILATTRCPRDRARSLSSNPARQARARWGQRLVRSARSWLGLWGVVGVWAWWGASGEGCGFNGPDGLVGMAERVGSSMASPN